MVVEGGREHGEHKGQTDTIANPVLVLYLEGRHPATHLREQQHTLAISRTTSGNVTKKRFQMFIQTEQTPNPATLKFLPGCPVMEKGTANFTDAEKARRSPLATALFGLDGISGIFLGNRFIAEKTSLERRHLTASRQAGQLQLTIVRHYCRRGPHYGSHCQSTIRHDLVFEVNLHSQAPHTPGAGGKEY